MKEDWEIDLADSEVSNREEAGGSLRFCIRSASEQVADHLRGLIACRILSDTMPGAIHLAKTLGVGRATADAALRNLEDEGLLEAAGPGMARRILGGADVPETRMRITLLTAGPRDEGLDALWPLRLRLGAQGFRVHSVPGNFQSESGDLGAVRSLVESTASDAWIVISASRRVAEYFASIPVPALALLGSFEDVGIAGVGIDRRAAQSAAVRRLVELGHRRIVKLRCSPGSDAEPGVEDAAFLTDLESAGLPTSPYNLPVWESGRARGLNTILEGLFRHSPPSAILLPKGVPLLATLRFLARRGGAGGREVALICRDTSPTLEQTPPVMPYFSINWSLLVRRIVRWATRMRRKAPDSSQHFYKARFVEGPGLEPDER